MSSSAFGSTPNVLQTRDSVRVSAVDDLYPMRVLLVDGGAAESLTFRRLTGADGATRCIVDHLVGARTGFEATRLIREMHSGPSAQPLIVGARSSSNAP